MTERERAALRGIRAQLARGEAEAALWKPVPRNRLIAYRDGHLVRTSAPHGYTFCEAILDLRKKFGDAWPEVIAS